MRCQQHVDLEHLADFLHAALDVFPAVLPAPARHVERKGHVVEDGHVRIERVVLEGHGYIALGRVHLVHGLIIEVDRAAVERFETGDQLEGRRLARAGRPKQARGTRPGCGDAHLGDRGELAVALGNAIELDFSHD